MQRICLEKTVSLFDYHLQTEQGLALLHQSLIFASKNLLIIHWISFNVESRLGLKLFVIDIDGNVTIDEDLFHEQLSTLPHKPREEHNDTMILKWLSDLVQQLVFYRSCSSSSSLIDRTDPFREFLEEFSQISGEREMSRQVIDDARKKCISYLINVQLKEPEIVSVKIDSIAHYYQEIVKILYNHTYELEHQLTSNSTSKSFQDKRDFHSIWVDRWQNLTREYRQIENFNHLKKVQINLKEKSSNKNDRFLCLHDRLMFEIKSKVRLKSNFRLKQRRKRIRPKIDSFENNRSSTDDENDRRDSNGRKRVDVIDFLLDSSSPEENFIEIKSNNEKTMEKRKTFDDSDEIRIDAIIQLIKNNSESLALTFAEFCHLRNVITRAELETLLFDEKLYKDVAQSKLCFTCRKVYFNFLTFTFGVQCSVCKQKVCRNCLTQIALPTTKLNDLPMQSITPLTLSKSIVSEIQTPATPTMNEISKDFSDFRRCSTPANRLNSGENLSWPTELINICSDCFFLLQHIRKKARHRHIHSGSISSSINRSRISTSSSAASISALLVRNQQKPMIVKSISNHSALTQTKSFQDFSSSVSRQVNSNKSSERMRLSRNHLFLNLRPIYDAKLESIKNEE